MKQKPSKAEDMQKKCKDYEDTLKRLQAEFENYKKQQEKMKSALQTYCRGDMILKLLPVLDSLDAAMKTDSANKGLSGLAEQLKDILEAEGLVPIKDNGQKADPYKHEIVAQSHDPTVDDDIITEVIQKGYMLDSKVIRHAKVKVNKKVKK